MPSKGGRATLATVAASAGVSVATVSKVLNGREDVGPRTRALVETLLAEHEYVARGPAPRPAARGSRAGARASSEPARRTVELVVDGDLNAYSVQVLQGVLDAATAADVAVVVRSRPRRQPGRADRRLAQARRLRADGRHAVIAVVSELTAGDLAALARARLPLVVIDPLNLPRAEVTSVGSTNFAGGLAATEHLLALGHRRVAHVGGPPSAACSQARLHGYRAAMEAVGAPVPGGYVRTGDFLHEQGVEAGQALLDLPERPTAVFAASDEMAVGVVEAARGRGLRVPEDLSVVGFDDTEVAAIVSPPLTTVRQPLREMGGVALRNALRLAAGEVLSSHHVELATELVVRSSTAPPPAH